MLYDNFNRNHDYLRISLTERCNLRCAYCMPEEGVALTPIEQLPTTDEIIGMAEIFVSMGVKKIRLTGGEPLVRKDVADIMLRLAELPVKLTITTNGLLVDRHIINFQRAGIRSLNVSLDTMREKRFYEITHRNYFKKVVSNIQLLIENGFHVKVNAVLIRGINDDEIFDFIEWTKDIPVHVRFIEFMPFQGNEWQWEKMVPYQEIIQKISSRYEAIKLKDDKNDTAKAFRIAGYSGTFAVISSVTNHFCGTCNRLRLTANGRMKNCLFGLEETDLLTPYRRGEDIRPLINQCLNRKKERHGGITDFRELEEKDQSLSERSMILIGG